MLNSLKWNSIESRNKELHLLTFYKIVYNCVNLPLPNGIQFLQEPWGTNNWKFVQLLPRIDAYKLSFYRNAI